jgi:LppX_LprAFG lipoprotein
MKDTLTILALYSLLGSAVLTRGTVQAHAGRGNGSPQERLNSAADAILRLKSAQFTIAREGAPAFLDEKAGVTFTAARCSYAAPDRVSCNIKISSKSGTILQVTRVWVPEGTFQSNPLTRQFGKVPADTSFNFPLLFARTGIPAILRTSVQTPHMAGAETIHGKSTVHLKGEVRGDKLSPLIGGGSTINAGLTYPVDLWMEEQSANPVRIQFTEPAGNGWLIELIAVNEPVDIPTPKISEPPKP